MLLTESVLRSAIRSILLEDNDDFQKSKLKKFVKKLNNEIKSKRKEKYTSRDIEDLTFFLQKEGMKFLGKGYSREVYHFLDQDWVLKIANSRQGSCAENLGEINIAKGLKGDEAKNIFVKVFEWDKINESKPLWLISEKVLPLKNALAKGVDMSKIFPTFYNAFNENISGKQILICLEKFMLAIEKLNVNAPHKGLSEELIYKIIEKIASITNKKIKKFNEFNIYDDFIKINSITKMKDAKLSNIGIRITNNPTFENLVVLDYMSYPEIKSKKGIRLRVKRKINSK